MRGASLAFGTFQNASLDAADLTDADVSYVMAGKSRFINADLTGAVLDQANLVGADLRWAHMDGVSLNRTFLQGANLRNVSGLRKESLVQAFIDNKTECGELKYVCDGMPKIPAPELYVQREVDSCDAPIKVSPTPDPY
jgi:uncharacterized protein YjbI with pentapeptide repeats